MSERDLRERLVALAQDWDRRLRDEFGVDDEYTDWHSRELRDVLGPCDIPCDDDCEADCHAGHYVHWQKPHPDLSCLLTPKEE